MGYVTSVRAVKRLYRIRVCDLYGAILVMLCCMCCKTKGRTGKQGDNQRRQREKGKKKKRNGRRLLKSKFKQPNKQILPMHAAYNSFSANHKKIINACDARVGLTPTLVASLLTVICSCHGASRSSSSCPHGPWTWTWVWPCALVSVSWKISIHASSPTPHLC